MTTTTTPETMTTTTPAAVIAAPPAVLASLPAQLLAAVAVAASRDETKQVLQCIHVKNEGEWLALAAVDGHRLITVRVPQSEHLYITTNELLLSADSMRKPGKSQTIEINLDGNFKSLDAMGRPVGAGVWQHPYSVGTFPNYQQLIPDSFTNTPKGAVTVNASYLLDWCKVCAAVTVKDKQLTSWETNSPTSPMVWTAKVDPSLIPGGCDDDVVMRHLIMPVQVRH
jgi:DNA polymerase III sliding clamp (beta) subunit (PCNA family)